MFLEDYINNQFVLQPALPNLVKLLRIAFHRLYWPGLTGPGWAMEGVE